jgi:hypothetical protein
MFVNTWHSNGNLRTYHRESPDFDISTTIEELGQRPWLGLSITTILVDTINDEHSFTLSQEVPRLMRLVREIHQCPVTDDTKEAR